MKTHRLHHAVLLILLAVTVWLAADPVLSQSIDRTQTPNIANAGIAKSLAQEVGTGRGDWQTPESSAFIIARDPFRAIRRGRQLFQRKFLRAQDQGPLAGPDGSGDINTNLALGAGLVDSCAGCHGRPRGAAGFGGDVVTRPDSRDAPHLFGLGLKEMLADEITWDLRAIRAQAVADARSSHHPVSKPLVSKGINYGSISANSEGTVDTSQVKGVDPDLRVRPFFLHGGTVSMREFVVGALQNEMGLQAVDPDLMAAHNGGRIVTPSGMVLDGSLDQIEGPPTDNPAADSDGDGVVNEIPTSLVDYFEFYLLNYFKPASYQQTNETTKGRAIFQQVGCAQCHISDLQINQDRRVADLETVYDPVNGIFNNLFATATPFFNETDDHLGFPTLKRPKLGSFLVKNIFTDFKRHDLGPNFYERNYDGILRTEFLTIPLWSVGSTAPYGHDGRSINLAEVIFRHGGEAQAALDAFSSLSANDKTRVFAFLNSLVLFAPENRWSKRSGLRAALRFCHCNLGRTLARCFFPRPTGHWEDGPVVDVRSLADRLSG